MTDSKLYHVALSREQIEIIIGELQSSVVQERGWAEKWSHDGTGMKTILASIDALRGIISELESKIGA